MIEYGKNVIGPGSQIFEHVTLGFPSRENLDMSVFPGTVIGRNAIIRSGTIIYCDVYIGDDFQTGHNVIIREKTYIENHVRIGTSTVIDGLTTIGNNVNLQSGVYIPTGTKIGDDVFIGPNAVLTNDRYPPSRIGGLAGPIIKNGAAIGANVTVLPEVCIGQQAFVAAGALVTHDVPDNKMAIGSPAKIRDLPRRISEFRNKPK